MPRGRNMAQTQKSENVPEIMQEKFDCIVAITNDFSKQYLNDEYATLIRFATAALCRKRPSPLVKGKDKTWACGITHAIGIVNFLFDSSRTPYISAKELYKWFGVASSTGQSKSKLVRDTLEMRQMDPSWCLPSKLKENPIAWMISVNGLIIDARSAPREIQEEAYAKGVIPYIPEDDLLEDVFENLQTTVNQKEEIVTSPDALFTLDVFLIDGPVTEEFVAENPQVSRSIKIKGSNTLKDLHYILFQAFDREEEHMYEFQIGGRGPHDPNARRYGLKKMSPEPAFGQRLTGEVSGTKISSLGLSVDESFGYWFDFGDDWWHQINVESIIDKAPKGKYPKITNRVGASPPQYADFD